MIQAKFKNLDGTWRYQDFNSDEELKEYISENNSPFTEYKSREQKESNWFLNWLRGIKNTKKNFNKVKSSPYATLNLALKFRKVIVGIIIVVLVWETYVMVKSYPLAGMMGTIERLFTIGIMAYVCWMIYRTIPQAKKQLEYYKKNPHLINYCPVDTKTTVDDIITKIKMNAQVKQSEGGQNVRKKETAGNATASSSSPKNRGSSGLSASS